MIIKSQLISFYLFLFQIILNGILSKELIQIHTLTRHGERSPLYTFPSDPYKHLWKRGLGQLSDNGTNQLKQYGSFVRNYYRHFLPNSFHMVGLLIKLQII